jgi:hypothetical protein
VSARVLLAVVAALLVGAGPAVAAAPSDLSTDPLDRATLLALPSVYRVDTTIRVDALRLADGTRLPITPKARTIQERGTAVAVAPGGWLVSAAHVATPDAATLARLAYTQDRAFRGRSHADEAAAEEWVRANGAAPVGPGVVEITVTQADAGAGTAATRSYAVQERVPSATADLALIRIRAPKAPALALDEDFGKGTPLVTIGFGLGSSLDGPVRAENEPAVRTGRLIRAGTLEPGNGEEPRRALAISVPVERGDSGGPVIDADGDVRGIVTQRSREGGIAEMATDVRQLLESRDIVPGPGASGDRFREAMTAFWDLDFPAAVQGFDATLQAFGDHTLAGAERARAAELAAGDFSLSGDRRRGALLAIAVVAGLAALACAAGLAGPLTRRGGRSAAGR